MKLSLITWSVLAMSTLSVLPAAAAREDGARAPQEATRTAFVQMSSEPRLAAAVTRARDEHRSGGERSAAPQSAEKAAVEPSTLGLMLAGLALIGLMLLRRRHD